MSDTKNKVTFGLKNVHVWPVDSTDESGKPTYGNVINWPGAVEMTLDAEGSSDPFYADDGTYYQGVVNSGYSGKFTSADIPQDFLTNIMGEITDDGGAHFENSDAKPKEFAIAFEFNGDAKHRRHVVYRNTATRPSVGSKTVEDKSDPNTQELDFTASPRLDNHMVKAWCEEGDACYDDWFTTPYEYTATPTT